ncbi:hypothetical protein [Paractinoplanes toevensis]|uniref:hypothetical protein n=1 Tax=Paractinoplanes toevensis TaxID=571911 RepID=UPI001BB310F3|nr:hypothetical protein [Actinoplanes toevensis]
MVDQGRYQVGKLVRRDVRSVSVVVEVLLREARLIQGAASALARLAVQLLRVGQEFQEVREGLSGCVEPLRLVLVELTGQPAPLVSDVPQPGSDLVLWPIRLADQIEEAIFLRVQLLEVCRNPGPDLLLSLG